MGLLDWYPWVLIVVACADGIVGETQVLRPRGVPLIKASLYDASKPFTCFDGSNQIPFAYVNDEYCDCHDASDEPGTSACSQGTFHCINRGFRSLDIPSSRVDDGICDCCDGSDESKSGKVTCSNQCMELGKQMRAETEKQMETLKAGYQKRLGYLELVKTKKDEKKAALEKVDSQIQLLETRREALVKVKEEAEAQEKTAVDKHKQEWEATRQEKEGQSEAEEAFKAISANFNILSHENIVAKLGQVGENLDEEIHEAIRRLSDITLEDFVNSVWPKIRNVYRLLQQPPKPTPPPEPEAADDHHDETEEHADPEDNYDKDEFDEEHREHDSSSSTAPPPETTKPKAEDKMPEYGPETQQLVEVADKARKELEDFDKEQDGLNQEKESLQKWMENDYGPDGAFAVLEGECFEYTDREYTYKMCPFSNVSQRPKDGGSETSLGKWGHWGNNFQQMVFTDGARCWNGPSRSAKIHLECGAEHNLMSASEPSRCEYEFHFETPVVCSQPPQNPATFSDLHDEL